MRSALASNVVSMLGSRRRQARVEVAQRWSTYMAPQEDLPIVSREVDKSPEAQARRFAFIEQHIVNFESNAYRATVWIKTPTSVGNPFGIGAEFSGRTLAHAVDAAINFINLTK